MTKFINYLFGLFDKKNKLTNLCLVFVSLVLTLCYGCADKKTDTSAEMAAEEFHISVVSKQELFKVDFKTEKETRPPINEFHQWVITIKDQSDNPVFPALFNLSGGMPSHGHGLPTEPKITKHLGDGSYLLEGVKFNMDGEWIFRLQISTQDKQDIVEISFDVQY